MKFLYYLVALFSIGVISAGCSTIDTVQELEGEGSKKEFSAPYEKVWNAAVQACSQDKIAVVAANKDMGHISAKTGVRPTSWGENISVWVRKVDANTTEVEVVSKKAGPAVFFHYDWERPILEYIENNI